MLQDMTALLQPVLPKRPFVLVRAPCVEPAQRLRPQLPGLFIRCHDTCLHHLFALQHSRRH